MLSKKEIKDIQSLSHKKFRDELNLFVAEGPKMVSELIELMPEQIEHVYAVEEWVKENKSLVGKVKVIEIGNEALERISNLKSPNQVLATVRKFLERKADASSFTLYIDAVQDPGNFGTMIRIADWFGITDIVCSPGCADLYNPKVIQSSMASIARVSVSYDYQEDWLSQQNVPILAATLDGESIYTMEKHDQGVLIIGNESKGIRKRFLQYAQKKVTIPKRGNAESLNAAVATGIILSHLLK